MSVTNLSGGGHVPLSTIHACLGNRQSPPPSQGGPDYGPGIRIIEDKSQGQSMRRPEDGWQFDPKTGGYFRTIPGYDCPDGNCPNQR